MTRNIAVLTKVVLGQKSAWNIDRNRLACDLRSRPQMRVSRCPETPGAKTDYWLPEVGNTGQAKTKLNSEKPSWTAYRIAEFRS